MGRWAPRLGLWAWVLLLVLVLVVLVLVLVMVMVMLACVVRVVRVVVWLSLVLVVLDVQTLLNFMRQLDRRWGHGAVAVPRSLQTVGGMDPPSVYESEGSGMRGPAQTRKHTAARVNMRRAFTCVHPSSRARKCVVVGSTCLFSSFYGTRLCSDAVWHTLPTEQAFRECSRLVLEATLGLWADRMRDAWAFALGPE